MKVEITWHKPLKPMGDGHFSIEMETKGAYTYGLGSSGRAIFSLSHEEYKQLIADLTGAL